MTNIINLSNSQTSKKTSKMNYPFTKIFFINLLGICLFFVLLRVSYGQSLPDNAAEQTSVGGDDVSYIFNAVPEDPPESSNFQEQDSIDTDSFPGLNILHPKTALHLFKVFPLPSKEISQVLERKHSQKFHRLVNDIQGSTANRNPSFFLADYRDSSDWLQKCSEGLLHACCRWKDNSRSFQCKWIRPSDLDCAEIVCCTPTRDHFPDDQCPRTAAAQREKRRGRVPENAAPAPDPAHPICIPGQQRPSLDRRNEGDELLAVDYCP